VVQLLCHPVLLCCGRVTNTESPTAISGRVWSEASPCDLADDADEQKQRQEHFDCERIQLLLLCARLSGVLQGGGRGGGLACWAAQARLKAGARAGGPTGGSGNATLCACGGRRARGREQRR
jgi:hypothetical protein